MEVAPVRTPMPSRQRERTSRLMRLLLLPWIASLLLSILANAFGVHNHFEQFRGLSKTVAGRSQFDLWATLILYLLPSLILIFTGMILLRVRRVTPVAAVLAIALLLFSATNLLAGNFWHILNWPAAPQIQVTLDGLAWLLLVLTLLIFPTGSFARTWTKTVAVAAGLFFVLHHFGPLPSPRVFGLAVVDTAFELLCIAALVIRLRSTRSGLERQQIRWALAGITLCAFFIIAWAVLTPRGSPSGPWTYWSSRAAGAAYSFGLASLGVGFLVALLRYRLFDLSLVVSRSLVFTFLITGAGILFLLGEHSLGTLLETIIPNEGLRRIAIAVVATGLIAPLKTNVTAWAERRLRQPLANLRDGLPRWLAEARDIASLEEITRETAWWVRSAVCPERIVILVGNRLLASDSVDLGEVERWRAEVPLTAATAIEEQPDDPLFPLRVPLLINPGGVSEPVGWLLIGPRKDAATYAPDERRALLAVSGPLARTIRAVERRSKSAPVAG